MGNVRGRGIAKAADRRNLRASRPVAWARDHARIDRIADDDIKARLGCRGATTHREAGVEHELGHLRGDQRVLLWRHHLDRVDTRGIVPG